MAPTNNTDAKTTRLESLIKQQNRLETRLNHKLQAIKRVRSLARDRHNQISAIEKANKMESVRLATLKLQLALKRDEKVAQVVHMGKAKLVTTPSKYKGKGKAPALGSPFSSSKKPGLNSASTSLEMPQTYVSPPASAHASSNLQEAEITSQAPTIFSAPLIFPATECESPALSPKTPKIVCRAPDFSPVPLFFPGPLLPSPPVRRARSNSRSGNSPAYSTKRHSPIRFDASTPLPSLAFLAADADDFEARCNVVARSQVEFFRSFNHVADASTSNKQRADAVDPNMQSSVSQQCILEQSVIQSNDVGPSAVEESADSVDSTIILSSSQHSATTVDPTTIFPPTQQNNASVVFTINVLASQQSADSMNSAINSAPRHENAAFLGTTRNSSLPFKKKAKVHNLRAEVTADTVQCFKTMMERATDVDDIEMIEGGGQVAYGLETTR